jgi:uncharacterized protein (TIGR02300 family)
MMAKAELGLKRTCLSCGMRFYDFNRKPITCPGCQAEFDPEAVIRSRRGRAPAKETGNASKLAEQPVTNDAVELDEDKDEAAAEAETEETGDGIGFGEADIDDDDDDNDKAGLIDNDLDEDEEIIPGIANESE